MDLADRLREAVAGRYAVERELGRGGMAVVFLARDVRYERRVAIKVLRPELSVSLVADRFLREIQIAAQLQHPLIVPLYDSGGTDDLLWYVMPFVEGETLRERLRREKQLPLEDALRITEDAAAALQCAHQHGFVHRDIKPENVLLSGGHAVIMDFGIARALTRAAGQGTSSGVAIGTPAYMSPEQASGSPNIDARTDIYSLGCVLYEMLVGEPPFTGPTPQAVIARHVSEPVPSVRVVRPTVSSAMEEALSKALAKVPADRYGDVQAFSSALGAGSVLSGSVLSGREGLRGFRRFLPGGLRGATAVMVATVALLVGGGYLVRRAGIAAGNAKEAPRIVVLPFELLAGSAYPVFAEGLADEVTSRLAEISGLAVIARSSAARYRSSGRTIREIGRELDADYALTGTVYTELHPDSSGSVRVIPHLVRTSDQRELWTDRYESALQPGEIFRVQAMVAQRVAAALNVKLAPPERQALEAWPTGNLQAYENFLRGNAYASELLVKDATRQAIQMYQQAVQSDPDFAIAWAKLAQAHCLYYYFFERTDEHLTRARSAIDRALAIDRDLPEGQIALGYYYYWGHLDYARAMERFDAVRAQQPNNSELLWVIGSVHRRQGRWDLALADFGNALRLDPGSALIAFEVAGTSQGLRQYEDAERYYDRAIALAPDWAPPYASKAVLFIMSRGDVAGAQSVLREAALRIDPDSAILPVLVGDIAYRPLLTFLDAAYQQRLQRLALGRAVVDSGSYYLAKALYAARREPRLATAYADMARGVFARRVAAWPRDPASHVELGTAYALLGRRDDAGREAQVAARLNPIGQDALRGTFWAMELARLYVLIGQYDAALDQLDTLLKIPSPATVPALRVERTFDPLRKLPRFQALLDARRGPGP